MNKEYWKNVSDETGIPPVESKVTRVIQHEVMHNVLAKLHSPPSQAVFGTKTTQEWDVLAYGTKDNKITVKDYDDSKLKVTGRGVEYPKEYKYLTLEQFLLVIYYQFYLKKMLIKVFYFYHVEELLVLNYHLI